MQKQQTIRILALDTATVACGYGVIDVTGGKIEYVACGVLAAPAAWKRWRRLREIHSDLVALIAELQPHRAAIEGGVDKYPTAALAGGESRGIALAALFAAGMPWDAIIEVAPTRAKARATGSGRADKAQVSRAMCLRFGLTVAPPFDATDALAIAVASIIPA